MAVLKYLAKTSVISANKNISRWELYPADNFSVGVLGYAILRLHCLTGWKSQEL